MDEHVVPAFTLDEAEALGSVEPFHCTFFFHKPSPQKGPAKSDKKSPTGASVCVTSRSISQAGAVVQPECGWSGQRALNSFSVNLTAGLCSFPGTISLRVAFLR